MRILTAFLLAAACYSHGLVAHAETPPVPPPPTLEATAWVIVDQASGQTLAGHRAHERVEPASITKLMTEYGIFRALREKRKRA